jgi:hypothetical protein
VVSSSHQILSVRLSHARQRQSSMCVRPASADRSLPPFNQILVFAGVCIRPVHNAANQGHRDVVGLIMERHRAADGWVAAPSVLRGYEPPPSICDAYEELRPLRDLDLSEAELQALPDMEGDGNLALAAA